MENLLKFRASYCNSYESCRGCRSSVPSGELVMAVMVQSRTADQKEPWHYHIKCFFNKQRLSSTANLAGFERLRAADQKRIEGFITRNNTSIVLPKGKGKKRVAVKEVVMSAKALRDFGVEYSVSSRAGCCGCRQKILKDEVRCKKMIFDTEVGMRFGGQPLWHHLECFAKLKSELGWFAGGEQLPGFSCLSAEDQEHVKKTISTVVLDEIPDLKIAKVDQSDKVLEATIKEQSVQFFDHRDYVERLLKPSNLIQLLKVNAQKIPQSNQEILDAVAELLTFGALKKCTGCGGQLVFSKTGYICTGNVSEWARCEYFTKKPARMPCTVPSGLKSCFADRQIKLQTRAIRKIESNNPSMNTSYDKDSFWMPKVERQKPPLYLMEIVILGNLSFTRSVAKPLIEKMGGKLVTKIHEKTAVIISNEKEIEKMNQKMELAKSLGIQVVPEQFLEEIKDGGAIDYITKCSISDWGSDPHTRINQNDAPIPKSGSLFTKSMPKTVTLKVIDGTAVDPKSGLVDTCHVYVEGDTRYTAVLNNVDITQDKNSYYTLQVLEANNKSQYYLFSAWGRIGTKIGDVKLLNCHDKCLAVYEFERLYKSQTGNNFAEKEYKKKPGKYYPIDLDFGSNNVQRQRTDSLVPSVLPQPVHNLMKILFDLNEMKKVMLEYDLDMDKMPLGKLSKAQISKALTVLSQMSELIKTGANRTKFIGACNHFYTLIPHNFGERLPPVIKTIDEINTKAQMLQNLIELEVAYSLLNSEADEERNPFDCHYDQLHTELLVVDPDSDEYERLERYLRQTHADTHKSYDLEIVNIFKVDRRGERKRFEPFAKMDNRKLLWHGSRTTNFVGILSHGLRIAPPEAPISGYMFGKGLYFADMVSKSANYCFTSRANSTGLLLLCEVALGTPVELNQAKAVQSLPKNRHSVKGIGKTYPNPECNEFTDDGVEVPLGIPITDLSIESSLLYNEYIVYDEAQVNIKYMFNLKFAYNY